MRKITNHIYLVSLMLIMASAGIFLLIYFLDNIDLKIAQIFDPVTSSLVLGMTIVDTLIYACLVYFLVHVSGFHTTLWEAYLVLTSSLSTNYVTPLKIGIPLRIYLYHHFMDVPTAIGTALVTVEALVGMLIPALLSIVGVVFIFPSVGLMTPAILIVVLLLGTVMMLKLPMLSQKFCRPQSKSWWSSITIRVINFFDHVRMSLRDLSIPIVLGVALLYLLMLCVQALRLWLILDMFGLSSSPLMLIFVLAISMTAGNLSLIPMGLGVKDVSFTLLLTKSGVPSDVALSVAVIQRLFSPGWPLLLGIISSNFLGLKRIFQNNDILEDI